MKRTVSEDYDRDAPDHSKVEASAATLTLGQYRFEAGPESRFKSPSKRANTQETSKCECCLPPLQPDGDSPLEAQFLILGSAPSVESLAQQRYYAHKHNHFWPIVARVFNIGCSAEAFLQKEYAARAQQLCVSGVVVWDMCKEFVRPGSADSNLRCKQVNDIGGILQKHSAIHTVGLNGQASFKLFKQHIVKAGELPREVRFVCLPSSSPLNAMKNAVEVKAAKWRECLGLNDPHSAEEQE